MKRRRFCQYAALGSACVTGVVNSDLSFAISSKSSQIKSTYRWVILYWMPYDNDLVLYGELIVEMLTRGTYNSDTAVIIQSDYWGDSKMRRRQLINGTISEFDVVGEDSSNASAFAAYLDWANQSFEANNWAVIVVGHGGKISEVSPDNHSTIHRTRTWMKIDQFASAVSNFNQAVGRRVKLLFFQNCNKATLEVLYESRNCAQYTLASQLTLGAPNYYYEGFLKRLQEPSVSGRDAAIAIMNSERIDMYYSLTLVDNQAIGNVPIYISRLLQRIENKHFLVINRSEIQTYEYSGEQHCDVLTLFNYLSKSADGRQKELTEFADFLQSSVITFYKTGGELYGDYPYSDTNLEKLCGLGLYFPETKQDISRYKSLSLYRDVDLVGLYRRFFAKS